ncbi:MFS general substrate transporter [Durotheca rogersii]|uniref:MFS general substrate transporter n=1 Tax=Durotheca rogersii TaxID=419775 RepID=UPI00221F386D|nr:MFS general substrate transporter [Durotheca rogersii]KAI5863057.1 MFS general substrate transporter [Durotheca rogersii]
MASQPGDGEGSAKPGAARLALVMIGICLAVLLTGMDQTILATATPVISNEFNTSQDFGWWSNAYFLTLSSFQLFYGKLYSLFPVKFIYLIAIVLFEVGSLVCTTAPNANALVAGRAVAGLGASGIFSGSVLILAKLVPLAQRAAYLGIMSAVFGLAAIVGPFLGAALIQSSTWRWCFGINLPLGAVTVVLCTILVKASGDGQRLTAAQKIMDLDLPGTVCMVASVVCLLLALQWGGSMYPWNNGRIIALFVISGVLAISFVVIQKTTWSGTANTIPRSIARNRDIWLSSIYSMTMTGGVYVAILYLPIWFQDIRGHSPLSSGVLLTPIIAGYVVSSIVAGGITSGTGYYNPAMILGTALTVAGSALLTTINLQTSTARIVGYQLVYGFGVGMGFGQPSYVVQTLLPTDDVPIGVTLITLVQNLSASVFVAVAQTIFNGEMRTHLAPLVPAEDASDILGNGLARILEALPSDRREQALRAISTSIIKTFYVSLAMSALSVVGVGVRWTSMKKDSAVEKSEVEVADDHQALPEKRHDATDQEHEAKTGASEVTQQAQ